MYSITVFLLQAIYYILVTVTKNVIKHVFKVLAEVLKCKAPLTPLI